MRKPYATTQREDSSFLTTVNACEETDLCLVIAALCIFDTAAGTPADLKAVFPVVERNTRGGARTFGFLSSHDDVVSFICGLMFSSDSLRFISRRWRRPNGAPVGGGWLLKRLMVAVE